MTSFLLRIDLNPTTSYTMEDKDYKNFKKVLESYREEVTRTKEKSQEFLIDVGVFTEKGNLKQNYKHLCIPDKED